jgi:hypothetical protein
MAGRGIQEVRLQNVRRRFCDTERSGKLIGLVVQVVANSEKKIFLTDATQDFLLHTQKIAENLKPEVSYLTD